MRSGPRPLPGAEDELGADTAASQAWLGIAHHSATLTGRKREWRIDRKSLFPKEKAEQTAPNVAPGCANVQMFPPILFRTLWQCLIGPKILDMFDAACLTGFLANAWGLSRLWVYPIAREFRARVEGRLDERLRVARELHDTLLQTFQASLVQMQAARNLFRGAPRRRLKTSTARSKWPLARLPRDETQFRNYVVSRRIGGIWKNC